VSTTQHMIGLARGWAAAASCAAMTFCMATAMLVQHAQSQPRQRIAKDEVGWVYSRARFAQEFRRFTASQGMYVQPAGVDLHPVASDTLVPWIMSLASTTTESPASPWAGEVTSWRVIAPSERLKHQGLFGSTRMAYVGNDTFMQVDTTATPHIRAKMQSTFGAPTETIVEVHNTADPGENIQFEYWFIVNDSIPVTVMDSYGPFDHGIVLSGDHRFRDQLFNLRQSLLGRMMREAPFGVYTDYFYDRVDSRWYRTGYDGAIFFVKPMSPPDLSHGRPKVAASQTGAQPQSDGN